MKEEIKCSICQASCLSSYCVSLLSLHCHFSLFLHCTLGEFLHFLYFLGHCSDQSLSIYLPTYLAGDSCVLYLQQFFFTALEFQCFSNIYNLFSLGVDYYLFMISPPVPIQAVSLLIHFLFSPFFLLFFLPPFLFFLIRARIRFSGKLEVQQAFLYSLNWQWWKAGRLSLIFSLRKQKSYSKADNNENFGTRLPQFK